MQYVNPPKADQPDSPETLDAQVPGSGPITLSREVLDRLLEYRRETGSTTWEQAIERLLAEAKASAAVRENMIDLVV